MARKLRSGLLKKIYKKGLARGMHTTAKYLSKDSRKLHKRARGIKYRGRR